MGVIILIVLFHLTLHTHCARILFVSIPYRSHFSEIEGTAHALKERGHEVSIFAAPEYANVVIRKGYNVIRLDPPNMASDEAVRLRLEFGRNFWRLFTDPRTHELYQAFCNSMTTDQVLNQVKRLNIDLLIVDMLVFAMNGFVIPIQLNIPYVTSSANMPFFMLRSNALSYQTPHIMTPSLLDYDYSFLSRASNTIVAIVFDILTPRVLGHHRLLVRKLEHRSLEDVMLKSRAFLLHQIPQLDLSYPLMPNVFTVGGGTEETSTALNLPNDLAAFIDGANKQGVIVMSLGSQVPFVPRDIAVKFAEAFEKLSARIVIRDTSAHAAALYPANVKVMKWIPQPALLAHKNTRIFITHGGNNGQMEAFVNGVPMIVLPNAGDQPYNGLRCVTKGYGVVLDFYDFKASQLVDAVNMIVSNSTFRDRMKRDYLSWRRLYSPAVSAADVVEAALRRETEHLVPTDYHDIDFFQYHMVDCVGIVMGVLVLAVCVVVCGARKLFLN